jgi:zinc protease
MNAVAGSIEEIVRYGLPDDYFQTLSARTKELELPEVRNAAPEVIKPGHIVWVVVGDLAKIRAGVEDLGLGQVRLINADGKVISGGTASAQ